MKKFVLAGVLSASLAVLAACGGSGDVESKVIATTAYGDITEHDLYEEMKNAVGLQAFQEIVLNKALSEKFPVTDEEVEEAVKAQKEMMGDMFEMSLANEGLTEETFKQQMKPQLMKQKFLASVEVDEKSVDEAVERAKKEIHARHILVEDEKTAKDLIKQIEDGADFEKLSKEHSTEPQASETGGDLGWVQQGMMVPPFENALYSMKKGEVSKEPVKSNFGYHIIEVLDIRDTEEPKDEEEVRAKAKETLANIQTEERLAELIKEAKIDTKDDAFKDAFKGMNE